MHSARKWTSKITLLSSGESILMLTKRSTKRNSSKQSLHKNLTQRCSLGQEHRSVARESQSKRHHQRKRLKLKPWWSHPHKSRCNPIESSSLALVTMRWRFSVKHRQILTVSIESKTMPASAVCLLWNSDHASTWKDLRRKNITSDRDSMIGAFYELLTTWVARTHLREATITALDEVVAEVSRIHITVQTASVPYLNHRGPLSILIKFLLIGWWWISNLSLNHLIHNNQTSFKTASSSNRKLALPVFKIINARVISEQLFRRKENIISSTQPRKPQLKAQVKVDSNSNLTTDETLVGNAIVVRTWGASGHQTAIWWLELVLLPHQWLIIW